MTTLRRQELLHQLSTAMRTLNSHSQKRLSELCEQLGMTIPQGIVLAVLERRNGQCTMSDLIRLTQLSGATLTGIVDRLVKAHYVERDRDIDDRRVVHVTLIDAGRALISEVMLRRQAEAEALLAPLSEDELEQLERLLSTMLQAIEPASDPPAAYNMRVV